MVLLSKEPTVHGGKDHAAAATRSSPADLDASVDQNHEIGRGVLAPQYQMLVRTDSSPFAAMPRPGETNLAPAG
jgi:hypothetical protein